MSSASWACSSSVCGSDPSGKRSLGEWPPPKPAQLRSPALLRLCGRSSRRRLFSVPGGPQQCGSGDHCHVSQPPEGWVTFPITYLKKKPSFQPPCANCRDHYLASGCGSLLTGKRMSPLSLRVVSPLHLSPLLYRNSDGRAAGPRGVAWRGCVGLSLQFLSPSRCPQGGSSLRDARTVECGPSSRTCLL